MGAWEMVELANLRACVWVIYICKTSGQRLANLQSLLTTSITNK